MIFWDEDYSHKGYHFEICIFIFLSLLTHFSFLKTNPQLKTNTLISFVLKMQLYLERLFTTSNLKKLFHFQVIFCSMYLNTIDVLSCMYVLFMSKQYQKAVIMECLKSAQMLLGNSI